MSIFNLTLTPARLLLVSDDMGFSAVGSASHPVCKVLYHPPKNALLFGQGTTVVGTRLFMHLDQADTTSFEELVEVARHGLDEAM